MPKDGSTVVLVADDEPSTRALVAGHLRSKGYKVIEASDGDEAWELAHEHLPHLVVLDVMMPGMSGWEVCRKIREAVSLAHTGIVMLTGIGENLNEMTSPLYGADAYVDKPFEFSVLDGKIDETLARRNVGAIGRGDGATEQAEPPPRPETEPSDVPVKSSDVRRAAARKRGLVPKKASSTRESTRSVSRTETPRRKAAPAAEKKAAKKPARVAAQAKQEARKAKKKTTGKKAAKKAARKIKKTARKVVKKAAKQAAHKIKKTVRKATKKAPTRKTAKKAAARKAAKKATVRKAAKKAPARKAARKAPARKAARKAPARKAARKAPARKAAKKAPGRKAKKHSRKA